jgi:hypothetical protein
MGRLEDWFPKGLASAAKAPVYFCPFLLEELRSTRENCRDLLGHNRGRWQ